MTSFIRSTRMPETEELAEGKPIFTTSQGLQLNLRINSTIDLKILVSLLSPLKINKNPCNKYWIFKGQIKLGEPPHDLERRDIQG